MSPVPIVSAIVLTSNRESLLRETVGSILAQDFPALELLIVDNMSADGTGDYVRGLADARVRYLRNPNGGILSVNRNLGIRQARGEFVAFCDDDDLWLPSKISRQVAAMGAHADAGLCFTNGVAFRDGAELPGALVSGRKHLLRRSFAGLLMDNAIPSCSVMVRRAVLEAVGGFDESPALVAVEDWELWLRIARRFPVAFLDDPLVKYRVHRNLSAKPSVTALRNMNAVHSVARKLKIHPALKWASLAYQTLKYGWFAAQGR